jgi:dTDP-4-dehydrorhamnose 3,5-epimerase-like enzyme
MAYMITLPTFSDERGSLSMIQEVLPFGIKRVFMIYDVVGVRGGHRHKKSTQALVCVGGSCEVYIDDGSTIQTVVLDDPSRCLVLEPQDWHTMQKFSKGSTLVVFASELYDRSDYIDEPYSRV